MTTQRKHGFPVRLVGAGLLVTATGWAALRVPGVGAGAVAAMVVGVLLAGGPVVWWVRGAGGTSRTVRRWSRRSRRNDGVANWWHHLTVASGWAMRRRAVVLRPSLGELGRWRRWRTPVTAYATELARVGRWHVWSPIEDCTVRVGGPRTGKTGELACRIVDASGPVIATSTRTDIVELTAPIRARVGAIHLFNPSGLGGWASTLKWSPLSGCRGVANAQRRAADMIPASLSAEAERWDQQARRVLAVLLHAAAHGEQSLRTVLGWVADPGPGALADVLACLEDSPESASMRLAATQFFNINERTKTSITSTIMPALAWLSDSRAAAVGDAQGDDLVDVGALLDSRDTVYLLGDEQGATAPLVAALTAEIAWQARLAAAGRPGGRLDPPLTIALDEAAIICPVPLDRWTADMGGRNISIHISAQSRAQMRARWGDLGAATILNNAATILLYGGARDPDDLDAWAKLSGERLERVEQRDPSGAVTGTTERSVPVLSPSQIANMPARRVMIVRRGMPVSIGRTIMAWRRRDIRRAVKAAPYVAIRETDYAARGDTVAPEGEVTP